MENAYGTREEHLAWCKDRALAYVEAGDLAGALASMSSDLRKQPENDTFATYLLLSMEGARCVLSNDADGMRYLIEEFP